MNSLKAINHQIVNITNASALLSTTMMQLLQRKVYPILISLQCDPLILVR